MPHHEDQLAIAERLQLKLLKSFEDGIDDGTITPTDRATLARLLTANGWNIDPARLPKGLQDKLTAAVQVDEHDDVIPLHRLG